MLLILHKSILNYKETNWNYKGKKSWGFFFFQWLLSWEHLLRNVDVCRAVSDYKFMRNKAESKFLTSQAEHPDLVNVCGLA